MSFSRSSCFIMYIEYLFSFPFKLLNKIYENNGVFLELSVEEYITILVGSFIISALNLYFLNFYGKSDIIVIKEQILTLNSYWYAKVVHTADLR